ncbi:hypothetical protein [Pseudomonas sp. D3-10]|uniref:hypothetical protein n=1 Tax=Pseudomonas sp. D3-10 TaxID=2817392 RepID=UPI003DA9800C
MNIETTEKAVPTMSERLTGKAWLYIIAAMGAGMLLGMTLISLPLQAQINVLQENADGWKKLALDYQVQSEQNEKYAARWQENANKASAASQQCMDLINR